MYQGTGIISMKRSILGSPRAGNSSKPAKNYYDHPWPAAHRRKYECGFCEREFKSAQALGGHMNVHRRDRALMRESSFSSLSLSLALGNSNPKNLYPNPNLHANGALLPSISSSSISLVSLSLSSSSKTASTNGGSTSTVSAVKDSWIDPLRSGDRDDRYVRNIIMSSGSGSRQLDFDHCGVDDELNHGVKVDVGSELDLELRLGCL